MSKPKRMEIQRQNRKARLKLNEKRKAARGRKDTQAKIRITAKESITVSTEEALRTALNSAEEGIWTTIIIDGIIRLSTVLEIPEAKYIILKTAGYEVGSLTMNEASDYLLHIEPEAWLMTDGSQFVLNGNNLATAIVLNEGIFEMNNGTISNGLSADGGPGVYIMPDADFIMNGGTIKDNAYGVQVDGGFYMEDENRPRIYGGIRGINPAEIYIAGGGISGDEYSIDISGEGYVELLEQGSLEGSIRMDAGVITISDSDITAPAALGIEIAGEGFVILENGYIDGGIQMRSGGVEITNSDVFGNDVKGIQIQEDGEVYLNGGNIGGGIRLPENGYLELQRGYITDSATYGVEFDQDGQMYMSGGYIQQCEAGGVYLKQSSILEMTNGRMEYNGGGVYVGEESEFFLEAGRIQDANMEDNGNSLIYINKGIFNMAGGTIGSSFGIKGTAVYLKEGEFILNDGSIRDNAASDCGGGIYIESGEAHLEGGTILYNTADVNGGGIYVEKGDLALAGTRISYSLVGANGGGIYVKEGNLPRVLDILDTMIENYLLL